MMSTAYELIEATAKARAKEQNMTFEQAFDAVLMSDHELRAQYAREQRPQPRPAAFVEFEQTWARSMLAIEAEAIQRTANELRERKPDLTAEQAFAEVLRLEPHLHARYQAAERRLREAMAAPVLPPPVIAADVKIPASLATNTPEEALSQDQIPAAQDALDQLKAIAADLVNQSGGILDFEGAFIRACGANPNLYEAAIDLIQREAGEGSVER